MTIEADGKTLYLYGLYNLDGSVRFDAMTAQPQVGATITVYGIIGNYNGAQMKNAWLVAAPAADSTLSIVGANTLGLGHGQNKFTDDKYSVTGVIKSIANTTYGNMTIEDAEGNTLYLYGLYSADGATRFDAMTAQPAVGDTITVSGIIGNYNGAQMKNAWMTAHTPAAPEGGDTTESTVTLSIFASTGTLGADETISWNFDNFTVTIARNGSTTAIRTTDTNHYRFYGSNKMTLVAKNGETIEQAIITVTESKYVQILVDSLTAAGYTATANGTVVTVTGIDASTFEFVNTNNSQTRFSTIEITFA